MATPQLENGFTSIADELLDAIIAFPFSKREYKVVFSVIRKTYGFGKKTDDLTVTQIAKLTGLSRPHTSATIRDLSHKNVLLKRDGKHGYVLGIAKNYRRWKRNIAPSRNRTCPETGTRPSRNGTHNKQPQYTKKDTCANVNGAFNEFWKAYPKKRSKGQAKKVWQRLKPDEQLESQILIGVERAKKSEQWQNAKYIPYPATWLNAEGWEDDIEADDEFKGVI